MSITQPKPSPMEQYERERLTPSVELVDARTPWLNRLWESGITLDELRRMERELCAIQASVEAAHHHLDHLVTDLHGELLLIQFSLPDLRTMQQRISWELSNVRYYIAGWESYNRRNGVEAPAS